MSCTRRKESEKSFVLGASGAELRMKLTDGTPARFLLQRGQFNVSPAPLPEGLDVDAWLTLGADGKEIFPEDSFLVTVLSADGSPAEVYS